MKREGKAKEEYSEVDSRETSPLCLFSFSSFQNREAFQSPKALSLSFSTEREREEKGFKKGRRKEGKADDKAIFWEELFKHKTLEELQEGKLHRERRTPMVEGEERYKTTLAGEKEN